MLKEIVIITNKYPNKIEPNVLVFVQQLVWSMADNGIKCTVICPMPININPNYLKFPFKNNEVTENGSKIEVYMPKYIGFGQSKILGFNPTGITLNNFTKAVDKVIKKMENKPDAVYGHFITPAGIAAARIGEIHKINSFMAYGEATTKTIVNYGYEKTKNELASLSGVIAVSTHNKNRLIQTETVQGEVIDVFPNGYRKERFYPRNQEKSRKKFGLPKDKFIVAFVGSYDHRKGIDRLIEAVEKLDDVYVICAGKGNMAPESEKCLLSRNVSNEHLPYFYSAADVFVLPTLNEGCSNAIIEAMACGLPIISSNLPFNDDILDETCSIRIDPMNISEINQALYQLSKDNYLVETLSKGSLVKVESFTLKERTKNILKFIKENSVTM